MVSLPEKIIRNFSGVRRRSREQKKVFLRKRCEARFLGMGRKNGLCLGGVCVRVITVEEKVICEKRNLSAFIGILGHF